MKTVGRLSSLQIGQLTTYTLAGEAFDGKPVTWTSAFAKEPVIGARHVGRDGVVGDRQADSVHHGGTDKAVLAYSAEHYPRWRDELQLPFGGGGFGENFTVDGLDESSTCIGDVLAVGEVIVQVSQARVPCWKISRRWGVKDLLQRVEQTGRTGWYLRVLEPGLAEAGNDIKLIRRTQPNWTVQRVNNVIHQRNDNLEDIVELATVSELAGSAREMVQARLRANNRSAT